MPGVEKALNKRLMEEGMLRNKWINSKVLQAQYLIPLKGKTYNLTHRTFNKLQMVEFSGISPGVWSEMFLGSWVVL